MSEHEPRYEHTIRWVYGLVPYGRQDDARARWVTNHLAQAKHWDALEEHLAFQAELRQLGVERPA